MARRDRQLATWNETVQTRDQQFTLKRTALLKEAARAFSSQGYHATSLDDVAKTLGVTKPALYYYIKNKQEILFECHMLSQDLGERAFEYAYKNGKTGREILLLFAKAIYQVAQQRDRSLRSPRRISGARSRQPQDCRRPPRQGTASAADDYREGHGRRQHSAGRSKVDRVLLHGRGQLDGALVRSGWTKERRGNREGLYRPSRSRRLDLKRFRTKRKPARVKTTRQQK